MKLSKIEKASRKSRIKYFGNKLVKLTVGRVTIAAIPTGPGRAHVAWAIHSVNDGKAHRKYGEWVALDRLHYGQCLPVEFDNYFPLKDVCYDLANSIMACE